MPNDSLSTTMTKLTEAAPQVRAAMVAILGDSEENPSDHPAAVVVRYFEEADPAEAQEVFKLIKARMQPRKTRKKTSE